MTGLQVHNENINVVAWPAAQRHLQALATKEYRLAAKAPTEFERGQHAGRGAMCDELMFLPEALAILAEEDALESKRTAHVKG